MAKEKKQTKEVARKSTKHTYKLNTKTAMSVMDAIKALKSQTRKSFDESIEAMFALKLSAKNKNESIRFSVTPKHSFVKSVRILVLTDGQSSKEATEAGADYVGLDEYVTKIMNGWMDFDVVIATPSVMPKIAKLGKVLGPKGIMPNPKTETVTNDVAKVIKNYKMGKVDLRMDSTFQISFRFGKISMTEEALLENFKEFETAILAETKRFGEKVVQSMVIKSTMSPALKIGK